MILQDLLDRYNTAEQQHPNIKDDFIKHFSTINVVNSDTFADEWVKYQKGAAYAESIGKFSVQGNSRESATPMFFQCQATEQCPFTSTHKNIVVAHELTCSPDYVARELYRIQEGEKFKCDMCDQTFLS